MYYLYRHNVVLSVDAVSHYRHGHGHGHEREGALPRKTLAEIEDSSQLRSRYLPVTTQDRPSPQGGLAAILVRLA